MSARRFAAVAAALCAAAALAHSPAGLTRARAAPPPPPLRADHLGVAAPPRFDTQGWVGASYTPAAASNSLWWSPALFPLYLPAVRRELPVIASRLRVTALRVFLCVQPPAQHAPGGCAAAQCPRMRAHH